MSTRRNHSAQAAAEEHQNFDYSKGEILTYLSQVKKGKGAGPYADPTDCIRDMGVFTHGQSSQTPYIDCVASYLQVFMKPTLPPRIRDMFSGVYAIAFHKDWPKNPHKIRPANIGSAPRRILTGILARHNKHRFCEHLLPYNFIAVKGGHRQSIILSTSNAIVMFFTLKHNCWRACYHKKCLYP
jgi:hypothetical protein